MIYEEYIKEVIKETLTIYGPDAISHLDEFRVFFEDATLLSAMKGEQILFTSEGNIPTSNIRQSLIASGIQKSGQLPMGRCFITNILEDNNIQDIVEEKLNDKMKILINKMRGEGGEYGINRYLAENPNADPNAFEIVDVLSIYNNLVAFGKKPPEDIKEDLERMFFHIKQNFIENGIGVDSVAYRVCEFCYHPENSEDYPLPAVTIAAMRKIASLDLYTKQQVRDGGPLFDNVAEVETVKNYFRASDDIKPGFLDVFKDALENIYNTARENNKKRDQNQRD